MTASDAPVSLRPTFYYRQAFPAGYRVPGDHRHASTEIMYVETGRCTFLAGGGPVTLGRGEFIFIPGDCAHGMEVRAAPCRIANLEFAAEAAAAGTGWVALPPEAASLLETAAGPFALRDDDAAVFQLLCGIIEELDLRRWGGEDLIRLRLGEMLIAVARLRRQLAEEASGSRHVRRAKEYLAGHYAVPVTVEEAARAIGVSRSHLQRLFHREVGITPNEYLTRIRLQHAKTLLARTDLPLVEVAARVGLESQQYLQNLFRRRVGMTPGRYRSSPAEVVTIEDKPCAPRAQARKTPAAEDARVGASEPMRRDEGMLKVLMLGAGSFFTSHLAKDIMLVPGLDQGEFALVDIDADRLRLAHALVEKVVKLTGKNWRVVSSTDRREVMAGAYYIINTIEVSGVATVGFDYEIPKKYGIDQCIGDTIGPGGIMKALRTIPAWVGILRDAEELCPGALVLNYTNPMSMMTLAAARVSSLPVVGLCHSVQGTSRQLAGYLGIPYEEMRWECGGINHLAWFTRLERDGQDLYPLLREKARDPRIYEQDPVRFEIMLAFGAFVTESSGHFSEYVPYFRKRPDLLAKYCREGYLGGSGFYARSWPQWRKDCDAKAARLASGEEQYDLNRSHEYASLIIEAHRTGRPAVIHGSVLNGGLIENLPADGVVEVPVAVDAGGLHPCRFGKLPPQLAALCRANMAVFELGVQAALAGDREAAVHAMMLDPLSAAVCSPAEIRAMAEELFAAEREFLPFS